MSAAEDRARSLLNERRHWVMSDGAFAAFAAALEAPREEVEAMRDLFALPPLSGE